MLNWFLLNFLSGKAIFYNFLMAYLGWQRIPKRKNVCSWKTIVFLRVGIDRQAWWSCSRIFTPRITFDRQLQQRGLTHILHNLANTISYIQIQTLIQNIKLSTSSSRREDWHISCTRLASKSFDKWGWWTGGGACHWDYHTHATASLYLYLYLNCIVLYLYLYVFGAFY